MLPYTKTLDMGNPCSGCNGGDYDLRLRSPSSCAKDVQVLCCWNDDSVSGNSTSDDSLCGKVG